jgi:hypothetical protein
MAETEIRGENLEELIKKAEKLPPKPTGTLCNLFRTHQPSEGGNGYSHTIGIKRGLYVQCFGECKEKGKICQSVIEYIKLSEEPPEDAFIRIKCVCKEPKGKIHIG